ncbi:hypothetical protein MACJ_003812 [Theileria orientalis]|uniref:Uncharacterized protein n=1 Tax=Theileria orientalis TaxID=68886 RepID=A0A976XJC0_THEOR|nr:hypothetical protein MACJ_003812 [Theileria orientalis]
MGSTTDVAIICMVVHTSQIFSIKNNTDRNQILHKVVFGTYAKESNEISVNPCTFVD